MDWWYKTKKWCNYVKPHLHTAGWRFKDTVTSQTKYLWAFIPAFRNDSANKDSNYSWFSYIPFWTTVSAWFYGTTVNANITERIKNNGKKSLKILSQNAWCSFWAGGNNRKVFIFIFIFSLSLYY